jgi:thiol-disulfide isomerase/thioredoxin
MVQGFPPEQLEAAGISIEPDLAWMVIDAYLDRAQRGLRQARAKQDAEWEQGCLRELEVLSKAQENLRPNLLRVVIINKDDSRNESDWVPVAQVTSRTAVATLIDVAIPVKLYSNEHELIWEGRFTFARVEPSGGNVIDRGIGKLLLSKAVADIEVGDVQFTFEHRTR